MLDEDQWNEDVLRLVDDFAKENEAFINFIHGLHKTATELGLMEEPRCRGCITSADKGWLLELADKLEVEEKIVWVKISSKITLKIAKRLRAIAEKSGLKGDSHGNIKEGLG